MGTQFGMESGEPNIRIPMMNNPKTLKESGDKESALERAAAGSSAKVDGPA